MNPGDPITASGRRVPPLLWIRVFEAAARRGGFLAAGRELSVSAAAVSRSVRELERSIGVDLFVRYARGVALTDAGRSYAQALTPALRQIASASAEVRAGARRR
jgi:LysR family transcriptional regulator, glycine cleavage system transcriptional activator